MIKEQFIHVDKDGNKYYYSDRKMTIKHREDGPAVEYSDCSKEWYINGKWHREDGPAIESPSGYKAWYINGKLHREDGPAVEYSDCSKEWYINGKHHREDGPAIESPSGYKAWYINDNHLSVQEFNARMNPVELTLDEIASKFGVSVEQLKIKK